MNLNFHQTFKPEKKYITELLILAKERKELTKEEISLETGIPQGKSSGKVLPHLEYAKFMNLIDFNLNKKKYCLKLTELGEIIYEEDLLLSEYLTTLLLHCMMIRPKIGADLWNFCFMKYPIKYGFNSKLNYLEKEINDYFHVKVNLGPLSCSYDTFFAELNILKINRKEDLFIVNNIGYDNQLEYLYGYVLYELWDIMYPNQDEITVGEFDKLKISNCFGWTSSQQYETIERLSEKKLVRLNKQLMPYTILRITNKQAILNKLFADLF